MTTSNPTPTLRDAVEAAATSGTPLQGLDAPGALLSGAKLAGANLRRANLRGADLRNADLQGAALTDCDLRGADLTGCNLKGAKLLRANLSGASLTYADVEGADMRHAELRGAELPYNIHTAITSELDLARVCIIPEGDIIGWKKGADGAIVKLRIPASARRTNGFGRACRAERAFVLSVTSAEGVPLPMARSIEDASFVYRPGVTVRATSFGQNLKDDASDGIHFFITREEATDYVPHSLALQLARTLGMPVKTRQEAAACAA